MADCGFCVLAKEKAGMIYEDGALIALMHPSPASPGHFIVLPKEHVQLFEQLPAPVASKLFGVANRLAGAAFEGLPALGGTNVVLENGPAAGQQVPHVAIHVIPRREGDGLQFEPPRRQLDEDTMGKIESGLREALEGLAAEPEPAPKEAPQPEQKKEAPKEKPKASGWVKRQLNRRP